MILNKWLFNKFGRFVFNWVYKRKNSAGGLPRVYT